MNVHLDNIWVMLSSHYGTWWVKQTPEAKPCTVHDKFAMESEGPAWYGWNAARVSFSSCHSLSPNERFASTLKNTFNSVEHDQRMIKLYMGFDLILMWFGYAVFKSSHIEIGFQPSFWWYRISQPSTVCLNPKKQPNRLIWSSWWR